MNDETCKLEVAHLPSDYPTGAPKKISLLDELFLKDGTSGFVCEFDKSPLGYDICIRASIGSGETVRRWIRRDEIIGYEDDGDRTASDYADANPVSENGH